MTTGTLRVSIISATLNSGAYLEHTIQTVVNQSYSNIEYIIVDGGSADATLDIIAKYRDRIAQVISEPDAGIYEAFNKGLRLATGDIIYFLNSDDYLLDNNIIAEVAAEFAADPNLAFMYGKVRVIDPSNPDFQFIRGRRMSLDELRTGEVPPQPAFFARVEIFRKHGPFDTGYRIAADFDFIIKCFQSDESNSLFLDREMAVFRLGGASTDPVKQRLMKQEQDAIIRKHFGVAFLGTETTLDINGYYKIWLESWLLHERGVGSVLAERGIHSVAIFGTLKTAWYLWRDFSKSGIAVPCFLDNNTSMQGQTINGIPVHPPSWLAQPGRVPDAVVLSIESNQDQRVRNELLRLLGDAPLPVITWKELVSGLWDGA